MTKTNIMDQLFSTGAHFGYSKTKRHPSVKGFIFGSKENVDIIDLEQTINSIEKAKAKLSEISSKGGKIIFVGNKNEIKDLTPELAKSNKIFYVSNR
jgi:small subunit ribosomal protein S2